MIKATKSLFLKNNHSQYRIEWLGIDTVLAAKIKDIVLSSYGMVVIDPVKQVGEWEKKSNNFRISDGKNNYLLRKHISIKSLARIKKIGTLTSFLKLHGVSIPRTIPLKNNKLAFKSNDYLWQMFEFISGNHFQGTEKEIIGVSKKIAALHVALSKFKKFKKTKPRLSHSLNEWNRLYKIIENDEKIDNIINQSKYFIYNEVEKTKNIFNKFKFLRIQYIHGDLHPMNIICHNGGIKAIIDFANLSVGELSRDFGNACHRFVRQYVVNSGIDWEKSFPKGLKIFIDGYQKINPLDKKEIMAAPYLVKDELLRKIYSDLSNYIKGNKNFIENGEIQKKLTLLEESCVIEKYFNLILR
jgi:Ser/Thr protein kinase RdoA (MazF antagonist)